MSNNTHSFKDTQDPEYPTSKDEKNSETETKITPEEQSSPTEQEARLVEEPSEERRRLNREFSIGFLIGLILNSIAGCIYIFPLGIASFASMELGRKDPLFESVWKFGFIWLIVNILILVGVALVRRKIFQGIVAGLALAFAIVLVIGACLTIVCYGAS